MQDFLTDTDGELALDSGDLKIGLSDDQHKKHLIIFEKGSLKEFPTACVGAYRQLENETKSELLREINIQFSGDGMKMKGVQVNDQGIINVDASYE